MPMPKMSNNRNYTVKLGDTPFSIAKKHGINLTDLTKINTKVPTYSPGVVVTIPGVTSAATTPKLTASTAASDTTATYTPPHEPMTGYEPPSGGNLRNLGGGYNWNWIANQPHILNQLPDTTARNDRPLIYMSQEEQYAKGYSDEYMEKELGMVWSNEANGWVLATSLAAYLAGGTTGGTPSAYTGWGAWGDVPYGGYGSNRNLQQSIEDRTYVLPGQTYANPEKPGSSWAGGGGHTTFHYNTITKTGGGGRGGHGRRKGKGGGGGTTTSTDYTNYANYTPTSSRYGLITWRY